MNNDEMIAKLKEGLEGSTDAEPTVELTGKERVQLLKVLLIDKRQEEKNLLELAKFNFIVEHRALLENASGPHALDGPQGLGRRLLEHEETTTAQEQEHSADVESGEAD